MPKKFWQFRNAADGGAELLLYGDIANEKSWFGDEVTPKEFANELAKWGETDEITVRINSGGGDVFAAQAIGNILEAHKGTVTATIDGVCASAATIVACHCDKVVAANDSTYMIHPVRMGMYGYVDAATLQQCLDAIATIRENIVSLYAKKTGREKDEVAGWMDATSWWTGAQAKENGFVDELTDDTEGAVTVENRDGVLFVNAVNMGLQFSEVPDFVRNSLKPGNGGSAVANNEPAGQPGKNQGGTNMEIKTVDDLRKAYPALVDQIEQAAGEAATQAERERIQGIEDAALPGAEELTNEAKFTKPMSVSDYAVALVKNAKAQGASYLAETQENAQSSGVNGVKNAPPVGLTDGDEFLNAIQGLGKSK
jgi:ATP-dependent protease ClpP protease subunit